MQKKSLFKLITAFILCIVVSYFPALNIYAADTSVIYTGHAEDFVFIPTTTDLFSNFKDVVPGDKLSQKITVRNTSSYTAEIFLRAEATETRFKNFLREINLSVTVDATQSWYNASAADMGTTGMTVNRSLGLFRPGTNLDMTVDLSIPITWGNEFQGGFGEVVWVFTVIEADPIVNPPVTTPVMPPYTPPPVTPLPQTEPVYIFDILKPVPETEKVILPETLPETAPVTGPDVIIIEGAPVPLGSAEAESPLVPGDVPPTGDQAEIIAWCAAAVLLTLLLTVLLYFRKRSADEEGNQSGK